MQQLALDIVPRLVYSPKGFVLHAGVRPVWECVMSRASGDQFTLCVALGGPRSGKTHLLLRLCDDLSRKGIFPHVVTGAQLEGWLSTAPLERRASGEEVYLIDDIDQYLRGIAPGASGPFVRFVESVRARAGIIVVASSQPLEDLPCDDHVMSRLRAAVHFSLGAPDDSELPEVLRAMARQRGIAFTERTAAFLLRRMRRGVPELERYFERLQHLSRLLAAPVRRPLLKDALARS